MTVQNSTEEKKELKDLAVNVKKLLGIKVNDLDIPLKKYGVSRKVLEEIVAGIRDWYEKQPHLPQGALDDDVIIRRLITQSFSIERVKEKIDNYYNMRNKMPETLCGRDPLSQPISKCLKQGYWIVLPKKTPDHKRVTIFRAQATDDLLTDIIKVAFMMGDYRLYNDEMLGDHWIFDFQHATLNHAMQFTPGFIVKIMFYLNYCFGPKVVAQYLVNLPPFAVTIVSLFKKSMTAKMVQRLYIYDNFAELFKIIPKDIFPKDYGGDEVSCQEIADEWTKTLQSSPWRQYFIDQENVRTDESKRHAVTKCNELFGVTGSFKKLDFD